MMEGVEVDGSNPAVESPATGSTELPFRPAIYESPGRRV